MCVCVRECVCCWVSTCITSPPACFYLPELTSPPSFLPLELKTARPSMRYFPPPFLRPSRPYIPEILYLQCLQIVVSDKCLADSSLTLNVIHPLASLVGGKYSVRGTCFFPTFGCRLMDQGLPPSSPWLQGDSLFYRSKPVFADPWTDCHTHTQLHFAGHSHIQMQSG